MGSMYFEIYEHDNYNSSCAHASQRIALLDALHARIRHWHVAPSHNADLIECMTRGSRSVCVLVNQRFNCVFVNQRRNTPNDVHVLANTGI